jgi:hypothetical protein
MRTAFSRLELREIAKYHQWILYSIVVAILYSILNIGFKDSSIVSSVRSALIFFQILSVYKLSTALKLSQPVTIVTIVLLFIPFIGLVALFRLNNIAVKIVQSAGIKVGFFGADINSID